MKFFTAITLLGLACAAAANPEEEHMEPKMVRQLSSSQVLTSEERPSRRRNGSTMWSLARVLSVDTQQRDLIESITLPSWWTLPRCDTHKLPMRLCMRLLSCQPMNIYICALWFRLPAAFPLPPENGRHGWPREPPPTRRRQWPLLPERSRKAEEVRLTTLKPQTLAHEHGPSTRKHAG